MTKLPFTRVLLATVLASSLVVAGCDVRNDPETTPASTPASPILTPPASAFTPGTHPIFDVALAQLPTVTDLPFLAAAGALGTSFDGTAMVSFNALDPADLANPAKLALNDLDGWSTNAYFDIKFSGSINPATVFGPGGPGQNVFLVKLNTGSGDPLSPTSIVSSSPVAPLAEQPSYIVDVVSLDGGTDNVVRILPTAPLDPAAKYLVFMINTISDGAAATTESSSYHALTAAAGGAVNAQLTGIASWLDATEGIAGYIVSNATGGAISPIAARDMVTVSYTFTTTDPQKTLLAMAAPRAALVQGGATVAEATALAPALSTPVTRTAGIAAATATDLNALTLGSLTANVADLYTGYITLPYYLPAPNTTTLPAAFAHLGGMWRADTALAAMLGRTVPQDFLQTVNTGVTTTAPDATTNVSWRYPFAKATGGYNSKTTETVPLQVTLPDPAYLPASPAFGGANCGQVQASQGGYPVVIYIHGITSDRTSVIALAHALAQACIATIAIDLPMHGIDSNSSYAGSLNVNHGSISGVVSALYGSTVAADLRERHFDQTLNGATPALMNFDTPNGYDESGSLFINLRNLQGTRDHLREAVQDLLNLNATLGTISGLNLDGVGGNDLNLNKVYVIGVSLGGIVGTTFTAVNQMAIAADTAAGFTSNLNPIRGLLVSAGGSQLTQILINSPTFGPVIDAALAAAPAGTTNRESFLNIAQATIDAADPVNFAATVDALNVPTLVQMIAGGGDTDIAALGNDTTTWIEDSVISNLIGTAPLAGTRPLADLLGAGPTTDGSNNATTGNLLAELTIGYHSSLLIPDASTPTGPFSGGEQLATGELQMQAVSFVLSGGAATQVGTAGTGLAASYTTP